MEYIFCAAAAAAAWGTALCYLREEPPAAALTAALPALLCAAGGACLEPAGLGGLFPLWTAAAFLLTALALHLRRRGPWGDALLALLLAQGAYALASFTGRASARQAGPAGYLLGCALAGGFLLLALRLRGRFPEADWREYDAGPAPGPERIRVKLRSAYWTAAALCLLLTAGAELATPESLAEVLAWSAGGACLWWFGVLLNVLLYACRRERFALLAEQQYRDEVQSFLNVIRSQRHDYNFHVQTIAGLIHEGKIRECGEYVSALEADVSRMNAVLPIRDPAVSAMILSFQTLAAREGIELRIDIRNDLAQIATGAYETNKIISNLLQNAIDETAAHRDKSYGIDLTVLKRGEYCVIRVSNALEGPRPDAGELGRIYRQGYTTKRGHEGVGLSSIRLLAARYHGTVFTQLEGDVIHFIAKIPIDCAKEPVLP